MATTVTVSCDRCGSIIPKGGQRGSLMASLDERYETLARSQWELCQGCYEHTLERIGDIAGVPSEDWRRPEASLEDEERFPDKTEALRVMKATAIAALTAQEREDENREGEMREIV
jgi:hypothetical protein